MSDSRCDFSNSELMEIANSAAEAGGKAVETLLQRQPGGLQPTKKKAPSDFVTEADLQSEQAILEVLERTKLKVFSEEQPDASALPRDFTGWLIDPLDSTISLVLALGPQYPSVMVSYLENGVVIAASIYFPLVKRIWCAAMECGAFARGSYPVSCSRSENTPLSQSCVSLNRYADCSRESEVLKVLEQKLRSEQCAALVTCEVPHSGIACQVASGKLGAVIHDNSAEHVKQGPWDIAPAMLLVREVGGVALTLKGEPVDLWSPQPFFFARSQRIADEILKLANG